jgi:Mg-chelatase subunit ChlD
MPIFDDKVDMENHQIGGAHYGYSAARVENLESSEYTLTVLIVDQSGSVSGFQDRIEAVIKEVVRSCRHSPRADSMMVRTVLFDSVLNELHGFRPLMECDADKYSSTVSPGGTTALFDASHNGVEALVQYSEQLGDQDFDANGIVVVITDGCDNASKMTANSVKEALQRAVVSESLESLVSILVGVNITDAYVAQALQAFQQEAGFTQYVELDNASESTLAKLADFVSRSISSQSQALGSGGASQSLKF